MSQVVQAPQPLRTRWLVAVVLGLTLFGVAVGVQPVIRPLILPLLAGLPAALVLLIAAGRVPALRRWSSFTAACIGVVAAALAYVVLYVMAAPTGFPSRTFGSPDAEISVVYVVPGTTELEVEVDTCNQDPHVTARETANEVRLRSNEKVPRGASGGCADGDRVTLDRPLGDRIVIDEATGKAVEVLPGETCLEDPLQPQC